MTDVASAELLAIDDWLQAKHSTTIRCIADVAGAAVEGDEAAMAELRVAAKERLVAATAGHLSLNCVRTGTGCGVRLILGADKIASLEPIMCPQYEPK